jgi:hypothetical protein
MRPGSALPVLLAKIVVFKKEFIYTRGPFMAHGFLLPSVRSIVS